MSRLALLSLTDKTGAIAFARGLANRGFALVSTGGTAAALRGAGLEVMEVGALTGFPEMLGGRVKTLHPAVHAGILARVGDPDHRAALAAQGIAPIDVVAVNLYAFERTVTGPHTFDDAVEAIDVGGPAMIRAAAKNHERVWVIVDPADYDDVLAGLDEEAATSRRVLAAKAFAHTAYYDSVIARYLAREVEADPFGATFTVGYRRLAKLRYGENPHQGAAVYGDPLATSGLVWAEPISGKELSYNNYLDADAAWEIACDLAPGACVIVKHGNPCGAASLADPAASYRAARDADPISAYGGIAAVHGTIDASVASAMTEKGAFLEVIIASDWTDEAVEIFRGRAGWGPDVRLLKARVIDPTSAEVAVRGVRGGVLAMTADASVEKQWRVVTDRVPSDEEDAALRLAWRLVRHVKSNGIVVAGPDRLLGVGAGQMNRVQAVRLALEQAGESARGAALASDAFFPFPDSIETAASAGVSAVVQPGGSKRDADVIEAANRSGICMVLTGVRHFKH